MKKKISNLKMKYIYYQSIYKIKLIEANSDTIILNHKLMDTSRYIASSDKVIKTGREISIRFM